MEVRTIKNVDFGTWKNFKILAAREGVSMASLLKNMVKSYEKSKSDIWGIIFDREKTLSDKEAKDLESISYKLRKERGFRI